MSPTMTEGNIATWKVKEGDSFSTGDVLLEIETDKASMDVEAQEDGIMAKIFAEDGSKSVKVGTRIAVLAEPGDDLSSLKIPEDTSVPVESAADNMKRAAEQQETSAPEPIGTPQNKRPDRDRPNISPSGSGQNPKYPLYPAVQSLIHANHIPEADVMKIPASGPGGRLLKGDVLAYLGTIQSDYSKAQSERIEKLGHLDLSNIKLAEPKAPAAATSETGAGSARLEPELPKLSSIALSISLTEVLKVQKRVQDTLGTTIPLSTFLARAVDQANDDLPLARGTKPSADALFNSILGIDAIPTTSRGTYLPQIVALPVAARPAVPQSTSARPLKKPVDIVDILSGKARPAKSVAGRAVLAGAGRSVPVASSGAINVFSLTVPAGEEKRARTFLERVKTVLQVEPGRLVL
ncbi:pyridoxine biosynthesis protein [Lithohypha guttulata]|uniref:Pyridoxine biosynthesis protein n=1 Tax=Lithohypha guttulata TaxID=1690604 RepID=A0AAN7T6V5_9EURO|nr:pyridoxine biosynthesis protein [Lithohypha guttulata]KAK5090784.1 pyridoxine biosynthesis protein [Lithohypha guttulata]